MPTSTGNPTMLVPLNGPTTTNMPAAAGPLTTFTGIRLNYPLQKLYMSGAVRRDMDGVQFNNGASLAASTAYPAWCVLPRASIITAIYLVIGTAPTGANCTLAITANGVSLLSAANYTVNSTTAINTIISLPLAAGPLSTLGVATAYPYLTLQASGFPYPILCTYTEGATTVHTGNIAIAIEFEPDDFNG